MANQLLSNQLLRNFQGQGPASCTVIGSYLVFRHLLLSLACTWRLISPVLCGKEQHASPSREVEGRGLLSILMSLWLSCEDLWVLGGCWDRWGARG